MDGLDRLIRALGSADASGRAGIYDDEENATKLLFAEMGTRSAPARPVMGPAWSEKRIVDQAAASIDRSLTAAVNGSAPDVVGAIVDDLAERIRENIRSNTPPPLAESTIAARRSRGNDSTATLIDTGDMLAAVRSEVKRGADGWEDW